jgi:hypothetical protein
MQKKVYFYLIIIKGKNGSNYILSDKFLDNKMKANDDKTP